MQVATCKRALWAALLASSLIFGTYSFALAVDGGPTLDATRGLILSHLPAPGSAAYADLQRAAGNPTGQPLEMTASEMWAVSADRLAPLKDAAAAQGVEVMELNDNSNHALEPMATDAPMTDEQRSMMKDAMRAKPAMSGSMMALPDPKVMEYELTKGMSANGAAAPAEIMIPLDAKTMVKAWRTSVEKSEDGYIWHGTIEGTGDPVTLLWWPTGRLSGQITYGEHHYLIKNMGGTMHGVVEMEPRKLPPEHAPMGKALQDKMHMRDDPLVTKGDASMLLKSAPKTTDQPQKKTDDPPEPLRNLQDAVPKAHHASAAKKNIALLIPPVDPTAPKPEDVTITLLVAYTAKAAAHYTNIEKDLIELAVAEANQSFRNSGINNVHIKLVHAYRTDYVESGTHFEHVFRFVDPHDGYMDEVHALRDEHKADIAALIVDDANGCGLSAAVAPPADHAFTVVHHECAALSYSLAHEIGHLIGARHNFDLDDDKKPYPFGHGFVHGKDWRTMMSYEESCDGCPRVPVWSNPRTLVHGVAAGDAATADNARVIQEGAARVAGFR